MSGIDKGHALESRRRSVPWEYGVLRFHSVAVTTPVVGDATAEVEASLLGAASGCAWRLSLVRHAGRWRVVEARKAFRAEHREAKARWIAGDRDVVFPAGTYWMRVHHRANVAGFG